MSIIGVLYSKVIRVPVVILAFFFLSARSAAVLPGTSSKMIAEPVQYSNQQALSDTASPGSITLNGKNLQKAIISGEDSVLQLTANIRRDHRIFGYERPDTSSPKMILISVFTDDVEGNPFHCPYGAYYQTDDMPDMVIKYMGKAGKFIKCNICVNDTIKSQVYIDKKWISFVK